MTYPIALSIVVGIIVAVLLVAFYRRKRRPRNPLRQSAVGIDIQEFGGKRKRTRS